MAFVYPDRASEVTTSTGDQGDIILQGPEPSFWSFTSRMAVGDETTVCREDGLTSELVRVRLVAPDRLRYLAVYSSSNGGSRVVWPAGQQRVYATQLGRYALLPPDAGQAGRPVVVQPDGTYGAGSFDMPVPTGLTLGTLLDAGSAGGRLDGAVLIRLVVTWDAKPDTDYELEIRDGLTRGWPGTASGGAVIPAGGGRLVLNVVGGYTYGVRLRARTIGGVSDWTPEKTIAATGDDVPPGPPTSVEVTAIYGGAVARFTPPADADTLEVRLYAAPSDDRAAAELVGAGLSRVSLIGLPTGAVRWLWLAAVDTSGNEAEWLALGPVTALSIEPGDLAAELGERIERLSGIDTAALDLTGEAALEAVLAAHEIGQAATRRTEAVRDMLTGTINDLIEQTGTDVAERLAAIDTKIDDRVAGIDGRLAGVLDRLGDAETAILTETEQRTEAFGSLASQLNLVAAQTGDNAAAILAEQTARTSALEAVAESLDFVSADVAGNTAAIQTESASRATALDAVGKRVDSVFARVDGADAALLAEQTARAAEDEILAESISTVLVRADEARAAVQTEETARVAADGALGQRIDSAVAAIAGNTAAIAEEATVRANADGAIVESVTQLAAKTADDIAAAVQEERAARTTAVEAVADSVDALATKMGDDIEAAVLEERTARTTAVDAVAQSVDSLAAKTTDDIAAAVSEERTARTTAVDAVGRRIDTVVARSGAGINALRRWDFATNTEGWGVNHATMGWLQPGVVRVSATGNDPMFFVGALALDARAAPLVFASITRRGGAAWDGALYFTTANHSEGPFAAGAANPNLAVGETAVVAWRCGAVPGTDWGTAAVNSIRLDLGNSAADVFDVHWVAVGSDAPGASTAALASEETARTSAFNVLSTRIDTVEARRVGGTNLVDNLNRWPTLVWPVIADATVTCGYVMPLSGQWAASHSPWMSHLRVGTTYCLSFKVRLTSGAGAWLTADLYPDTLPETGFSVTSAAWQTFSTVWTPTAADIGYCALRFFLATAGVAVEITDVKLEEGNTATAWSASPIELRAVIKAEETARIEGNTALADQITTVQTTVDGHTASIRQHAQSLDGLSAQYTVKVDVNGYVAGFGLATTAKDGVPTSTFTVLADKFEITSPGGSKISPFVVQNGTVYLRSVVIGTGWIGDAHIGPNGIDAKHLKADSVLTGSIKVGSANGSTLSTVASNAATGAQDPAARINQGSTTLDPGRIVVKGTTTLTAVGGWLYQNTTEVDGGKIAADTITAREIAAEAVTGEHVVAGTLTVDKFAVFSTGNMLVNSGYEAGWECWNRTGYNNGGANYAWGADFEAGHPGADWILAGGHTLWAYQKDAVAPNEAWIGYYSHPDSGWLGIPVTAGKSYEFSLYTGAHRCKVQVGIAFYDAAGVNIGEQVGTVVNDENASGGRTLAQYKRIWCRRVVPAGAATARPFIVKGNTKPGYPNSLGFFALPFFGECAPNASDPQPWQPGGVTKITGGQLAADSVIVRNSAQLGATTVQTLHIGPDQVTVPRTSYEGGLAGVYTGGWIGGAGVYNLYSSGQPIVLLCSMMQILNGATDSTAVVGSYPMFRVRIQRGVLNAVGNDWDWVDLLPELGGSLCSGDISGGVMNSGVSKPWHYSIVDNTQGVGWRAYRFLVIQHRDLGQRTASIAYRSITAIECRR